MTCTVFLTRITTSPATRERKTELEKESVYASSKLREGSIIVKYSITVCCAKYQYSLELYHHWFYKVIYFPFSAFLGGKSKSPMTRSYCGRELIKVIVLITWNHRHLYNLVGLRSSSITGLIVNNYLQS